jgi:hypothetical protein
VHRSLLAALVLGLSLLVPTGTAGALAVGPEPAHPEWGSTQVKPTLTIKKGCHRYAYSYAITPPDGDWSLETFLIGPGGKQYGSGFFLRGEDPLNGASAFRLCRRSTKGGTYTIRALLTVQNGADYVEGYLPDTTFRLKKPR